MTRIIRLLLAAVCGLLSVLAVAGVAGWLWLRTSLPETGGTVEIAGARAPVEIMRDANGVPHIFAGNAADAYLALGYVHAQDRLWQMETMRRMGAGRLSEIFGEATVRVDRYSRTFGLYRLAEDQAKRLPPGDHQLLDAYTQGVNAFLQTHSGALPPEFALLRHEPQAWRPADSLVWAKIMAMQLSRNWQTELLRWRMSRRLSAEQIRQLWPGDDRDAPITLSDRVRAAALPLHRLAGAIPKELTSADASNAWVVDGAHSATGKPILANDPHLGFGAPVLWYLAHVEAPGLSLTGATVPGVPLLVLGHNGHIAWGMTTTGGDVEDLYLEDIDPGDPARYMTPDGPKPFRVRKEEIRVKDRDPVVVEVREARHGPVVSDILGGGEDGSLTQVIAMSSAALRAEDDTARALFAINAARDWAAFLDAARHFDSPQQNLFYADTSGGIGLIAPARIPIRRSGNGLAPVSGADGRHDWTGFIPFDDLPRTRNPSAGIIVNANNRLVGPEYPFDITHDWDTSWRAVRIEEMLAAAARHSVDDAAALQMDTLSTAARRLMPLLLAAEPGSERAAAAMRMMRNWDYRMRRDRPEPLIYAAWVHQLMRALAADELGPAFEDYGRSRPGFIAAVLTRNRQWCDDITTQDPESCAGRIARALDIALDEIAGSQGKDIARWRWGALHQATFIHRVFTHVPLLGRLADLAIESDGGNDTVNRGLTAEAGANPFAHTHGAGFRAVYDLADLSRSRFIIATGQSGNPLSPHYGDMLQRWRDGGHVEIATDRDTARRRAASILTIAPKPRP